MFGRGFFGGAYFGSSYWPTGATAPAPPEEPLGVGGPRRRRRRETASEYDTRTVSLSFPAEVSEDEAYAIVVALVDQGLI